MKKFLCLLPGLAALLALSGCCANDVCVCNDRLEDALYFRFNYGAPGAGSFTASDIDTVTLFRTNLLDSKNPTSTTITTDSLIITRPLASATTIARDTLIINNAAPFASAGGKTKLSAYVYRLEIRPDRKRKYSYKVSNIKLTGKYNADGCCTCYENTSKQLDLTANGVTTTQVVTDSLGQPKVVRLTRYP